jgi:4-aminobutyrate aminotransferase-like enzyme
MAEYCLDQLEMLFKQQTTPEETAAIIMEPVLGEGGYVAPPRGFLREVKRIANDRNVLFIADEVQSGFGRTGKMFAVEHFDVVPDILV